MTQSFVSNTFLNTLSQPSAPKVNVSCEIIFNQGRAYSLENIMMNVIKSTLLSLGMDLARELIQISTQAGLGINTEYLIEPLNLSITNLHSVKVFGIQLSTALFFFVMWLGSSIGVTVFQKDFYKRVKRRLNMSETRHHYFLLFYPVAIGSLFVFSHALAAWSIVFAVNGASSFSPNPLDSLGSIRALVFLWYVGLCPLFINGILHQILPTNVYSVSSPLFLVINLVSAGSLYDYVQVPDFFKYGYALPMRYVVRQLKVMFFGSLQDTSTTNLIVLTLWIFIPAIFYLGLLNYRIKQFLILDVESVQKSKYGNSSRV